LSLLFCKGGSFDASFHLINIFLGNAQELPPGAFFPANQWKCGFQATWERPNESPKKMCINEAPRAHGSEMPLLLVSHGMILAAA
jgi:hypothetical protein